MPYIKQEDRKLYNQKIQKIADLVRSADYDKQDGELNYIVSSLLHKIYEPSYYNYNRAIGVLENIKQEFYRKVVAPYEDKKITENGDI